MARKKILVVDDEAHITHVVSLKLGNAGYDIITANDGEEALELALQDPPDLVITDLQMPYMSGVELCARLREDPKTTQIPVIMLTARGYALAQEDLDRTNIKSVMSKPFSPRQVLEMANDLIGHDEQTIVEEAA
ncbi:MAG: response regulator [Phycisphaeraceae bacterium]|nr:MAG: response regulator [Phycisphaeraceae bacterium]